MLIVFTEEPSMKEALEQILPRLGLCEESWRIIAFQGRTNMLRTLPGRLRAWRDPRAKFLILRDNDGGVCHERKAHLQQVCISAGKRERTKIRIVCQELEAWFIDDLSAIEAAAFGRSIATAPNRNKWRQPDELAKPSKILNDYFGFYPKIEGAWRIAAHLDLERNISPSFNATVSAIRELAETR